MTSNLTFWKKVRMLYVHNKIYAGKINVMLPKAIYILLSSKPISTAQNLLEKKSKRTLHFSDTPF